MLIVEGPDGAGKTTLARRISEELGLEYRKNPDVTSARGSISDAGADWADEQIRNNDFGGVYDRFWFISEVVYQLVRRDPIIASGERMVKSIIDLANIDPVIIFCLPPWETSREVIRAQPEKLERVGLDQLEKVHWAYWSMFAMWSNAVYGNALVYDFTHFTPSKDQGIVDLATERLATNKRRAGRA